MAGRHKPISFARLLVAVVASLTLLIGVLTVGSGHSPVVQKAGAAATGIQKIKHVIVVMMENRSFDSYFGAYPGAAGIPMQNGVPTVCNPNPSTGTCDKPYVDHNDVMQGGPHGDVSSKADVDGGKMDGFVRNAVNAKANCVVYATPDCADGPVNATDVMGYHVASDIPNYWSYAKNFVLQDHMFESVASWSEPAHLSMVSGWSAECATHDPNSCVNDIHTPGPSPNNQDPTKVQPEPGAPIYAWTDLTYLLFKQGVSWRYYVTPGTQPDCTDDDAISCIPVPQSPRTLGIWNPLPYFDTVRANGQVGNVQSVSNFYSAAKAGTLPAVSWVVPSGDNSEHPPSTTTDGQSYVTSLVNAVMRGPNWSSTAIFVTWDDWGGFYDHLAPPSVDVNGYGIRVPGLLISPYAKKGAVDHQTLSFDAYMKFIEDIFLGSRRIDPATDGRPDPRPSVRENAAILGDLANEFDFLQTPRAPVLMPVHPATTLVNRPPFQPVGVTLTAGDASGLLAWRTPLSNGGLPITGYRIVPVLDGLNQPVRQFGPDVRSATIAGLTNGKVYSFKVSAINALGPGIVAVVTPPSLTIGAPLVPRSVTATAGTGRATVTWQYPASSNGSAITGYDIAAKGTGSVPPPVFVGRYTSSFTFTGLTTGKRYSFTVAADNSRGEGVAAVTNTITVK
jgi:phospholipase C